MGDADIPHARWRVRAENEEKSVSTPRNSRFFSLRTLENHALALLAVSSSGRPLLSPVASTRRVGLFPTRTRFPGRRHRDTRSSRGERSRRRPHFPSSATLVIGASGAGEPAAPLGRLRRFPFSEASSSWPQSRLRDLSCCQAIERGGRGSVRRGRRGRRGSRRVRSLRRHLSLRFLSKIKRHVWDRSHHKRQKQPPRFFEQACACDVRAAKDAPGGSTRGCSGRPRCSRVARRRRSGTSCLFNACGSSGGRR